MPPLTLLPPRVLTADEERAVEQSSHGFFDSLGASLRTSGAAGYFIPQIVGGTYPPDPDFRFTEESIKSFTDGLDPRYWDDFENAVSEDHAHYLRDLAMQRQETQRIVASAGTSGVVGSIAADLIDPVFAAASIGAGVIAGPVAPFVGFASRATRIQRMVRGGLLAASTDVPIQAYVASQDPDQGFDSVVYTALASFTLGGLSDLWVGRGLDKAARAGMRRIEAQDALYAMGAAAPNDPNFPRSFDELIAQHTTLTEEGRRYFKGATDPKYREKVKGELVDAMGLDPVEDADMLQYISKLTPDEFFENFTRIRTEDYPATPSVQPPDPEPGTLTPEPETPLPPPKLATDFDLSPAGDSFSTMSPLRFDMTGRLGQSDSPTVRFTSQALGQESVGRETAGGETAPTVLSAERWVKREYHRYRVRALQAFDDAYSKWAAEKSITTLGHRKARENFAEQVGQAVRYPKGTFSDPHVNAAADAIRSLNKDLLALGKRHGLFEGVEANDRYLTRVWKTPALDKATARFGDEAITGFLARAIERASPDLDADRSLLVARGMLRTIRDGQNWTDLDRLRLMDPNDRDTLKRALEAVGATQDQIDDVLYIVRPKSKAGVTIGSERRRASLDETYSDTMPLLDGTGDARISVADLLENNAETIVARYARSVLGGAAEKEVLRRTGELTGRNMESFRDVVAQAKREGATASELARLDTLHRGVRGVPLTDNGALAQAARLGRSFNYLTRSGTFGIASVPELFATVGEVHWSVTLQNIPTLARVFSRAADGKLNNELLSELETFAAIGLDHWANEITARLAIDGGAVEQGVGRVDDALRRAQRAASNLNLLAPVTTVSQRWAGALAARQMTLNALSGKTPSVKRLADMGMTPEQWKAVASQIKKHATTENDLFGRRRLRKMNLAEWDDQTAASLVINGLDLWSNRVIQTSDLGAMSRWMTTDAGKIITQFMNFALQAHNKQFLHRVSRRDQAAFLSATLSSVVAGLIWVGQTYTDAIGREDREEFLAERLSAKRIAAVAFQRGGYSALLPGVIDNALYLSDNDPIFAYGRQSGLSTVAFSLDNNPTASTLKSLAKTARAGAGAVRDTLGGRETDFTQGEARAIANLVPFGRLVGVKNMIDAFVTQLPEQEPE